MQRLGTSPCPSLGFAMCRWAADHGRSATRQRDRRSGGRSLPTTDQRAEASTTTFGFANFVSQQKLHAMSLDLMPGCTPDRQNLKAGCGCLMKNGRAPLTWRYREESLLEERLRGACTRLKMERKAGLSSNRRSEVVQQVNRELTLVSPHTVTLLEERPENAGDSHSMSRVLQRRTTSMCHESPVETDASADRQVWTSASSWDKGDLLHCRVDSPYRPPVLTSPTFFPTVPRRTSLSSSAASRRRRRCSRSTKKSLSSSRSSHWHGISSRGKSLGYR